MMGPHLNVTVHMQYNYIQNILNLELKFLNKFEDIFFFFKIFYIIEIALIMDSYDV